MCVCLGLARLVLWKWFSSILPQFLGCLGVLVPGCVCVLSSLRCVVHANWCRTESLCLGPLYFLWIFTRICVVFGALSS